MTIKMKMPSNSLAKIWEVGTPRELLGIVFETPNGKKWQVVSRGFSERIDPMSGE